MAESTIKSRSTSHRCCINLTGFQCFACLVLTHYKHERVRYTRSVHKPTYLCLPRAVMPI
jgi:hypothetical protein